MAQQWNMTKLFSLAALTSAFTSGMLFFLLYTSSYRFSSLTCVNYPPQISFGDVGGNYRQNDLRSLNYLPLSSATIKVTEEERGTDSSVPFTSDQESENITRTVFIIANNASTSNLTAIENSDSATKPVEKVEQKVVPKFKSWTADVITEIRPSIRHNCSRLRSGDAEELQRTQLLLGKLDFTVSANYSSCDRIRAEFSDNFYVSDVEREFPLAFVLVVHTSAQQILRFLKVIYRPQNVYCVHPDPKSGSFFEVFRLIADCLPNVFIASRVHHVKYRHPSTIFRAQMSCFRDLVETKSRTGWKYVINLCGRELPLKTNRKIVESLMKMNGTSVIKPHPIDQYTLDTCFLNVRNQVARNTNCTGRARDEGHVSAAEMEKCEPFLRNNSLKLYKSMTYNAYSRKFVRYFLYDRKARALEDWLLRNCRTPEEHFYAMVSIIPGAPGGNSTATNPVAAESDKSVEPGVFKTVWYHYRSSPHRTEGETCSGKVVHSVCIMSAAELPRVHDTMTNTSVWFLNKYFMEEDHVIMDCVEAELCKSNREEFLRDKIF